MGPSDTIKPSHDHPLILFDGVCNLCNGAVQFVINRDKEGMFRFASLQSSSADRYLKKFRVKGQHLYSILLIKDNKLYDQSNAILEIARELSGLWPALYAFKIIPAFIRNAIYKLVASNRYRIFGKKDECMIPTPELKARFLQ